MKRELDREGAVKQLHVVWQGKEFSMPHLDTEEGSLDVPIVILTITADFQKRRPSERMCFKQVGKLVRRGQIQAFHLNSGRIHSCSLGKMPANSMASKVNVNPKRTSEAESSST